MPEVTGISRSSIRARVDFPEPDSPTTASTLASGNSRLTSSTAVIVLPATENSLVTFWQDSRISPDVALRVIMSSARDSLIARPPPRE